MKDESQKRKLCFNCFERVKVNVEICPKCSSQLTGKEPSNFKNKDVVDYEEQFEALDKLEDFDKKKYYERYLESDIKYIAIFTSLLGIFQIILSGLVGQMNRVLYVFNQDLAINPLLFTISGFLYFGSVLFYYLNFTITRKVMIFANLLHLVSLFDLGTSIGRIEFYLLDNGNSVLPIEFSAFVDSLRLYKILILGFALLYSLHIVFSYKREVLNIKYQRGRR